MIQNKNFTYNGIINILESFANAHLDVRRFASEDEDQMSEITSKEDAFPMMFVAPEVNTFDLTVNTMSFKIFVYDRLLKDRTNITDIRSKTNQIIADLDIWLRDEDELPIEITDITTAYTFSSELMTDVTGWWVGITVDVPSSKVCNIPFDPAPVVSGWTCDISYTNKGITCADLPECPTIIDLSSRIKVLEDGGGGGGLTCGTLATCEIITSISSSITILEEDIEAKLDCDDLITCPTITSINQDISDLNQDIVDLKQDIIDLNLEIVELKTKEIWTVELMDVLTSTFYAPVAGKITSSVQIVGSGTVVILVNDLPYTLGTDITLGSKVTVTSDSPVVINLNILK